MKKMIGKQQDEPGNLMLPSNPTSDPNIGGNITRPTLMGPGTRSQMIDMGPAPTKPGFKFPSSMWTE